MRKYTVNSFSPAEYVPQYESPWLAGGDSQILEYAHAALNLLYSSSDIFKVRITLYGPCVATYRGYFNKALKASWRGDTKNLSTKVDDGYLFIRLIDKVERKAPRQGKVTHIIR